MLAYKQTDFDNLLLNEEAAVALHHELISKNEAAAIEKAYPNNLYSPNIFIRIGFLLLTILIVLMVFGLFCLMASIDSENTIGVITLFFSFGIYGALEFFIKEKKHFRAGIDDALIWLSIIFLIAAVNLLFSWISLLAQSVIIFLVAAYFTIRFSYVLMAGLAFIALLAIVFYGGIRAGAPAKMIMPFLLMAISFGVYWLTKKYKEDSRLRYYRDCCTFVETLSLVTLYIAGNYFVVRETSNAFFGLQLKEGESIPGGWFFWITTVLLPLVYIFRGIQKKDVVILRTGLILVAGIVFTVRYYHAFTPLEVAMSIGGIIMIVVAYFITKYLTPPKHGFTHAELNDPKLAGLIQVESLVITQTFESTTPEPVKNFDFGGGSGGGGGASGNY